MKTRILFLIMLPFLIIACNDDKLEGMGIDFTLSETSLSFKSQETTQAIGIVNPKGQTTAKVTSKDSDWCTISIIKDSLVVTVSENILVANRNATILVTSGDETISVLVRQSPKHFTNIAAVQELKAIPGPGRVTLKWVEPTEDNFAHVVISYEKRNEKQKITIEKGITEYLISDLLSADGEYTFHLQSFDKENDKGEVVSVSAQVGKLVAFRFQEEMKKEWLPYYLKVNDKHTSQIRIGSEEFNQNESISIQFQVNEAALVNYNSQNNSNFKMLPATAYTLPNNYTYLGETSFQNLDIMLNTIELEDGKMYALPLAIKNVSDQSIHETMGTTMLLYHVDDLQGWYTVDRLSKSGEGAASYPANPNSRRRYIKRTGPTTWQTGYLFRTYSTGENHIGKEGDTQFISINPTTKAIHIQQGQYGVKEHANSFNIVTNELNIEYLYSAWAGWWNHERMYNRSFTK